MPLRHTGLLNCVTLRLQSFTHTVTQLLKQRRLISGAKVCFQRSQQDNKRGQMNKYCGFEDDLETSTCLIHCVDVADVAVRAAEPVLDEHNDSVKPLQLCRCGRQDDLCSGNYRRKEKKSTLAFFSRRSSFTSEALLVRRSPQRRACSSHFLSFCSSFALKSFPPLFPPIPLSSLLLYVFTPRHDLLLLLQSQLTPCWGWGTTCPRSRTGKWPR